MRPWTASDTVQLARDVAGIVGAACLFLGAWPVALGCAGVWLACESVRLWRGWPKI